MNKRANSPLANSKTDELVFLPLGGSGEIGMNLNLYGFGPAKTRQWLMVDLGVTFGHDATPGIDLIMPDTDYIEDYIDNLVGLVLTHAHEDHIGAVAHLWPRLRCPVYATPFTATLVRAKLIDKGIENDVPLHIVELGARFSLGPFDIEFVTLTHSIPEPNALAIRTPLGTIMHTGDWKIDPEPLVGAKMNVDRLIEIGDEGVRAIICDSTNVFSKGTAGSESEVAASLIEVIRPCKGRVAVTTFASNVARVESIAKAAQACDRHVVLVGRSMFRLVSAAREAGYLADLPPFLSEDEIGYIPNDKVLMICTGSQGEPRAALARIVDDSHRNITLSKGDTVIFSSRIIPGNEQTIFELQNQLSERGIHVITERDHFVHVSGHPCRDDLVSMYQWIRPELAIPVHGEARHLAEHTALALQLQVPQAITTRNGLMTRIAPGPAEVIAEVTHGRIYLDGEVLTNADDGAVQERRKLAFAGAVFVSIVLDDKGEVRGDPQVVLHGLPQEDSFGESFEDLALDAVDTALDKMPAKKRKDDADVAEAIRRSVRGSINREWGKKAQVSVVVTRI